MKIAMDVRVLTPDLIIIGCPHVLTSIPKVLERLKTWDVR
jgi:predicted aconitase